MTILSEFSAVRVVPVISIDDAKHALPLADALLAGGLPIAEITLRTNAGLKAIAKIARHRPQMLVGAGTVLSEDQVDAAKEAGAKFALAPGMDPAVVAYARTANLPFVPGVMTPSDIQLALRETCKLVKFFPAVPAGGLASLKSMATPYLHTGLQFIPTGGVTPSNMLEWLGFAPVAAVGGSWVASKPDINDENWDHIAELATLAVNAASVSDD